MRVRLEPSATDVLAGAFAGAGAGAGLLVVDRTSSEAEVRPFHSLLTPAPAAFPFAASSFAGPYRGGRLAQNGGDGVADVARVSGTGIQVAFGEAPGTLRTYPITFLPSDPRPPPAFIRLLDRAPGSDVLVVPYEPGDMIQGRLLLVDFDAAGVSTVVPVLVAPVYLDEMTGQRFEAFPIRLSAAARANAIDDIALPGHGGVVLFLHSGPAAPATVAAAAGGLEIVEVGGNHGDQYRPPTRPPWLPDTVRDRGHTLGVAALDVDLDGDLDLVFPQSFTYELLDPQTEQPVQGELVWVEWTGAPDPTAAELRAFFDFLVSPWHDLGSALGLPDPVVVRQVEVGGVPAAAVWDRDLQEIVVVWPDYGAGILATWRAPAPGRVVSDVRQVDVVGTATPDLVVVVDNTWGTAPPPDAVLVYPDSAGPTLSWAPGSPGAPLRGVDHRMEVLLGPAGPITVEWIEGLPTTAPAAQGVRLVEHVVPATCEIAPPDLAVMVRATDDTGVFTEIFGSLAFSSAPGALSIRSAGGALLVLEPDGVTTAVFDAVAATSCGVASWGGTWPSGATVEDTSGPGWLRRTVVLTEATYPALLADPSPAVSVSTTDPAAVPPVVTLRYGLDASRLVEVIHETDRATLADGEIAVLRTRVRSRISVPLPGVRIVDALAGLVPAGPPSVTGAAVVALEREGAEIVLDALPAAPAEVTVELPVRAARAGGGSAVEARSSAGWLLTPAAGVRAGDERLPGCGCGSGSGTGSLAVLLLALALRRARRVT